MYMWYAKTTYGGYLVVSGGTGAGATVVFSPMIHKVVGKVETNEIIGQNE